MSDWNGYLDLITLDNPECRLAVIAALETGEPMAKFENGLPSEITKDELKTICDHIRADQFFNDGIYIGGEMYNCGKADKSFVRGQKGDTKLVIYVTNLYIVAAAAADSFAVVDAAEKLSHFLINNGF